MKKTKNLLATLLVGILLLSGCNNAVTDETDTIAIPETSETEVSTDVTELTPAKHDISVAEVESLLAANGLQTNLTHSQPYGAAFHEGQQMRVCKTERGTYMAFCKGFEVCEFYVAKIDSDNRFSILYFGEYKNEGGTIPINIGQDTNGDIYVTVCSPAGLDTYVFDHGTDEMNQYSTPMNYAVEMTGYTQTMFDFANRKIYAFQNGGIGTGDYLLEWFTFDMETMQWAENSTYTWIEGVRRHGYLYPIPDGNGGAYIVAERDDSIAMEADRLQYLDMHKYLWDELRLFHIPDLASTENITYVTIHEAYAERGQEGIWSYITNNNYGNVFMDTDGYLHVTYKYYLVDQLGNHPDLDIDLQYRHAIFDGIECIFNEKIELTEKDQQQYKLMITQSTDGTLYMIVFRQWVSPIQIEIYKADDELGKTWTLVSTKTFTDEEHIYSASLGEVRNGSLQDNILSCFAYGSPGFSDGYSYCHPGTAYYFSISLEDYSVTEPRNILDGYDLEIDAKLAKRAHNTAHQTKIVHTENASYAAFVYNHNYSAQTEDFHIVKIDKDNVVTLLYSGTYASEQNKFLTVHLASDGIVYVCPPTGNTLITVDTADNTVCDCKISDKRVVQATIPQQTDILISPSDGTVRLLSYQSAANLTRKNSITSTVLDTAAMQLTDEVIKYTYDRELQGGYTNLYKLDDNKGGFYLIGTRNLSAKTVNGKVEDPAGFLHYNGYTDSIDDSILLFYSENTTDSTEFRTADIQPTYEAEGSEGIWSVVNMADNGDAYVDSEGKLHVFYTYYHFDFDDADRPGNPALVADTLKHYHAVYDGTTLVSMEELNIACLTKDSSVRMVETTDGTPYLLVCNIGEAGAKIDVYFKTENGWALVQTKQLGDFTAESFSISSPRGGSVQDNVIDCIVYATDNDVYYTSVTFE